MKDNSVKLKQYRDLRSRSIIIGAFKLGELENGVYDDAVENSIYLTFDELYEFDDIEDLKNFCNVERDKKIEERATESRMKNEAYVKMEKERRYQDFLKLKNEFDNKNVSDSFDERPKIELDDDYKESKLVRWLSDLFK